MDEVKKEEEIPVEGAVVEETEAVEAEGEEKEVEPAAE